MKDQLFKNIESKTNVKKEDILSLARAVQTQDLTNEDNLRKLIHDVASLANKEVSKDKEERIIKAIRGKGMKDIDKLI